MGSLRRAGWLALIGLLVAACDKRPANARDSATTPEERPADAAPPNADGGWSAPPGTDLGTPGPVPPEGCFESPPEDDPALAAAEREARRAYACAPLLLTGRVVTPEGAPVGGAEVRVHGQTAVTGGDGAFVFPGVPRRNALIEVEAEGFRAATEPVQLRQGLEVEALSLPPIHLSPRAADVAHLVFGGDVMMGRRFLDPDGSTPLDALPPDDPQATLQTSDPGPGSRAVLNFVRPLLEKADLATVNLESPVTDEPWTPHPSKSYVFFTLPGSAEALAWAGVDYVSLGNNHVHDYLAHGLEDTLAHLDALGLRHSGAGQNAEAAFRPAHVDLAGTGYSLLSMSSITEGGSDEYDLLASDGTGGAADLRDGARVSAALQAEKSAGRVPIALLHTGSEYSERPTSSARGDFRRVVDAGAALVIAHHPHVSQGLAWQGDVLVAQSLGNFVFDQDRHDTSLGLLAEVALRGESLQRAALLPVHLKRYRPLPLAGALADQELRRLSALSREGGVTLVPHGARGLVVPRGKDALTQERTIEVPVTIDASGMAVVDLRPLLAPGESLAAAELDAGGVELTAGRDILLYGDFEDYDVDDRHNDAPLWDVAPVDGHVCQQAPHRGSAALCLTARSDQSAMADFQPRVLVPLHDDGRPNRWLTLVGWARGAGAGRARIELRYEPAKGGGLFGTETVFEHDGGDLAWTKVTADLTLPKEPSGANDWNAPRALRVFLFQSSTSEEGVFAVDDLALVSWETQAKDAPLVLQTPHARDFLRVEAPPGEHPVRITLRAHSAPRN